jgi:hypothetical protein
MANTVTAVVLGGQPTVVNDVSTVQEIAERLSLPSNHSVLVNGNNSSYDSELGDYDFVSFGSKVEGGHQ